MRNMKVEMPEEAPRKKVREVGRSQFNYPDPKERDRQRSSWAPFERMCEVLAEAEPAQQRAVESLDFQTQVIKLGE